MSNRQAYEAWVRDAGDIVHRLKYDLGPDDIVFDAGGYVGEFALKIHGLYGSEVHIFEPVGQYCNYMSQRFAGNEKIKIYQCGLGNSNQKQSIAFAGDSTKLVDSAENAEETVLLDVKEFMEELGNPQVSLFKINIEGGEYDLIDRLLETGLIKNFTNLQVQFHDFHPNAVERYATIREKLKETHDIKYEYPFVWEGWTLK